MKPKPGIGPSGVISAGGGGPGGGHGKTGNPRSRPEGAGVAGKCFCTGCGLELRRVASAPCKETPCPQCGTLLVDAPDNAPAMK